MYKAVLFDMDGVIFDTERILMKCWIEAGKKFGLDISNEHLSKFRGTTANVGEKIFREMFGNDYNFFEIRKLREELKDKYIEENKIPVKNTIEEFLKYLKQKGIKRAIATSSSEDIAKKYLEMVGFIDYFDVIICGDMIEKSKPEPDIYLKALEKLNLKPEDAVVFEDSRNGILAGYSAGCDVIMVVDIDESYQDIEDKIIFKIYNYDEAIEYFDKIGRTN